MIHLEKRHFQPAPPQPAQPAPRGPIACDDEPRSASYALRRRPVAPDFHAEEAVEPLADSVRKAAEEHPDLAVATASSNGSTS